MRHTDDTARGSWIRDRLGDPRSIACVIPTGFEAYARIFHPVDVQRIEWTGNTVRSVSEETITWAETARRLGTVAHPLMQWNAIAPAHEGIAPGENGWQRSDPAVGSLPFEQLATVSTVLRRHTVTPDDCVAALWEGWGWMRGHSAGSVAFMTNATDPDEIARLRDDALRPIPSPFSLEVWAAPRLELPDRTYLLFDVEIEEITDPGWAAALAWHDSPNLIWPEDRAWFLASEIDFDSTLVGGSRALVDELIATEAIEASEIPPEASLQWDADTINPRPDAPYPWA